ncbi:MAG: hypothetical protein HYX55_05840 [Chloroflexi bacterium]|nr:hypothetical protein [Chloroflexota bacterium]
MTRSRGKPRRRRCSPPARSSSRSRSRSRSRRRPAALLLVVGFLMVLVTYSGSHWFTGLHAYSGL